MSHKRKFEKAFNKNGHDDGPIKKKRKGIKELNLEITQLKKQKSKLEQELNDDPENKNKTKLSATQLQSYKEDLTPNEVHFFDYCKGVIDEAFNKREEDCGIFIDEKSWPGGETVESSYFYSTKGVDRVYKTIEEFYSNTHNLGLCFEGVNQGSACTLIY